jgi:uncharacterized membrane protein HdeD (DUF308 family)
MECIMSIGDQVPRRRAFDFSKGGLFGETPIDAPETVKRHWGWIALLGVVLIAGGLFAAGAPVVAGLATTIAVGIAFAICGAVQAAGAFRKRGWRGRLWHALSAAVYLIGGVLLVVQPLAGTVALSLLIIAVMIVQGFARVMLGFRVRPEHGWGWIIASGAVSALAGLVLVFFALPVASLTLLGIFVGISLIIDGATFLYVAFAARPTSDRTVEPDADA